MRYAENTSVSVERSKAEIEKLLSRYGAEQFISGWDQMQAYVGFKLAERMIKIVLNLPDRKSKEFTQTPGRGYERTPSKAAAAWEQSCRQKWRALLLVIKAKLEAVESGISEFDDEFLAYILLPDGKTVQEYLKPQIRAAYLNGKMPKLLPYGGDNE